MSHLPSFPEDAVIELEARTAVCKAPHCHGTVVRHSLGGGQSVDRCTRCFRRYRVLSTALADDERRGPLRRALDEFVGWRE